MPVSITRPPTLEATVKDALRAAILGGELVPGAALREVELSASLNVSRLTLRQAVRSLQDEGLVEVLPHRGAFVKALTPTTAREIFTLRAVLEPFAVRVALEERAYSAGDLDHLDELVHEMGRLEKAGDIAGNLRADGEFHHLMCERSNHGLLLDALRGVQSLSLLFMLSTKLYKSDVVPDEFSHAQIAQAIRQGDPPHAAEILRVHLEEAGALLLESMGKVAQGGVTHPAVRPR